MSAQIRRCELSKQHIAAVERRRRVVVNFDSLLVDPDVYESVDAVIKSRFTFIDEPDTCIDSVWWNWGEGNVAAYPSKFLPRYNVPGYEKWFEQGIDIVKIFQQETHKRDLEVFFSHRMNGGDNDPQFVQGRGTFFDDTDSLYVIPLKREHPDWLIKVPCNPNGLWNYAVKGVRDYELRNLSEIAQDYDFDGIELDFARSCPVLPPGHAWENRDSLTEFMYAMRQMTLEVEKTRNRPFLLATRVPENLVGCRFDGIDIETWIRKQLVDIIVMGCRSFEIDVAAFRTLVRGTPLKLYCALDDHHSSDGYAAPPLEVLRGVFANWYRQGTDGVQTFNFKYERDPGELHWDMHLQAYRELGDYEKIRRLDKVFVVQRRGGGHGPSVIPNPEDWSTPRYSYHNTNMLSQLPATLAHDGRADTLLTLYVGDDVNTDIEGVRSLELRVLLSDPEAAGLPPAETLDQDSVRDTIVPKRDGGPPPLTYRNIPPKKKIEENVEVRINNIKLNQARVDRGWLVFKVKPVSLALGPNLIGLRVTAPRPLTQKPMFIEKLELHVKYSDEHADQPAMIS